MIKASNDEKLSTHISLTWQSLKNPNLRHCLVFDCSVRSSQRDVSLSDCLYTESSASEKFGEVLLRHKIGPYAYTAAIMEAFLRIGLIPEAKYCARFHLSDDLHVDDSPLQT